MTKLDRIEALAKAATPHPPWRAHKEGCVCVNCELRAAIDPQTVLSLLRVVRAGIGVVETHPGFLTRQQQDAGKEWNAALAALESES